MDVRVIFVGAVVVVIVDTAVRLPAPVAPPITRQVLRPWRTFGMISNIIVIAVAVVTVDVVRSTDGYGRNRIIILIILITLMMNGGCLCG